MKIVNPEAFENWLASKPKYPDGMAIARFTKSSGETIEAGVCPSEFDHFGRDEALNAISERIGAESMEIIKAPASVEDIMALAK